MRVFNIVISLISSLFFSQPIFAIAPTSYSPTGYWKTVDDKTGQPKSIIKIWQTDNQQLMGKVVKIYPADGSNDQTKVCTACKGDNKNQPIVQMVILSGLKPRDGQWQDGQILDPANGKTYSCNLKLDDNGKKLQVHGYIGIPILGRSQTWDRVDLQLEA